MSIKLVLFDLDGTLLDDRKALTDETMRALTQAAEHGILMVPATGRSLETLPKKLREFPGLHYAILINGAQVYDCIQNRSIYQRNLSLQDAGRILDHLRSHSVLAECFAGDGKRYIERKYLQNLECWDCIPEVREVMRRTLIPVDHLWQHLCTIGFPVQKIHLYTQGGVDRDQLMADLAERFPCASVVCSVPRIIEITHVQATKGDAMKALCRHLHISTDEVMAFGDERNDLSMLQYAGIGVAMGNSVPELKEIADLIARPNTENGVAAVIDEKILGKIPACC